MDEIEVKGIAIMANGKGMSGQATHDEVLIGMHFFEGGGDAKAPALLARKAAPSEIANAISVNCFDDCIKYIPQDLAHMSYADFWKWWFEFERYKGDEAGLISFEKVIDECMARGMKVKVDLAYSSSWCMDNDWTTQTNRVVGPRDKDEWIHLCELLGRRYRGKIVLYMLQGESNNLENYWEGADVSHAHEIFRTGYFGFKKEDPNLLISIAGASPSVPASSDPKEKADSSLDSWVGTAVEACKPYFDDICMNLFVDAADPYGGMKNYYSAIKRIYDKNGIKDAEIGSGESSIQWAETSWNLTVPPPMNSEGYDFQNAPYSEMKQAFRMNESMGDFYQLGGTKFMWWGTEFAPGVAWPWRWGFRKYEDHWGVWPEDYKIPGTKIVFKHEGDESATPPVKPCDLRPAYVRPEDPYHSMWETFKFWAQAAPPASEAVRLPMTIKTPEVELYSIATFQQSNNLCMALLQSDKSTTGAVTATVDLAKSGWPKDIALTAETTNENIDYATGLHTTNWSKAVKAKVAAGKLTLQLPAIKGWTTVIIRPAKNVASAEYVMQTLPDAIAAGSKAKGCIVVRNTGAKKWNAGEVSIAMYAKPGDKRAIGRKAWKNATDVASGENTSFGIEFPAQEEAGYATWYYRLRDKDGNWFGPVMSVSGNFVELEAPRKFVAHRELGHIRLQWFAPKSGEEVKEYRVFRAEGFQKPFKKLASVKGTEFMDESGAKDHAYYYNVRAVSKDGKVSRPSNDDNARALSKPRIWDAEIVAHTIPARVQKGVSAKASITIKNTGQRDWDLSNKEQLSFRLKSVQCWGVDTLAKLPEFSFGEKTVKAGKSVTVDIPYVAPTEGTSENHWIMEILVQAKEPVMFGTPLLVETVAE